MVNESSQLDAVIEMAGKSLWWKLDSDYSDDDGYEYDYYNDEEEEEDDDLSLVLDMTKLSLTPKKPESSHKPAKKFLLIFNLSGLLLHRAHKSQMSKIPKARRPDGAFANKMVYKRPFCEEFMRFCLENFEVRIWSSAMEHNVDAVMDLALGELKSKLLFNQTQCSDYGIKCVDKKEKHLFFKEIKKVWESSHKEYKKGSFSATNTLLLDDTPSTGVLNPLNTGVYPYSYDAGDRDDNALDSKGELRLYLKGLAEAEDIPSYVTSNPFGQPAIQSGHPHWVFYSRVIRSIKPNSAQTSSA